jgi:DNA modification methylase
MKPTEIIGNCHLYLGDCREVLPHLPKVDLVLTDPPYGINRDGKSQSTSSHGGHKGYEFMGWDNETPSAEVFDLIRATSENQIIWGGNYYPQHLTPSMGWLVWDKGQRIDQSDCELAYTSFNKALRSMTLNRAAIASDGAVHPTQKPVYLIEWSLNFAPKTTLTVADPFMGSGTTGVACANMGKTFYGIEREPKYFDIACKRIEATYAQGRLFA